MNLFAAVSRLQSVLATALLISASGVTAAALTPTPTPTASIPRIDLPNVIGMPGSIIELSPILLPMMDAVHHLDHEFRFARETAVVAGSTGGPDCVASAEADTAVFEFKPAGCIAQIDCTGIRAVLDSAQPFSGPAVLYTCRTMITDEPRDTCIYRVSCTEVEARDDHGSDLQAFCTDGSVFSSYYQSARFTFSVDPPRPTVGDQVVLQLTVSGSGTPPRITLLGAEPFFAGDLVDRMLPAFGGTAAYHLQAVRAGTAMLQARASYTTLTGCPGRPGSANVVDGSQRFAIEIDPALVDSTTTPSMTPTPSASATATPPATATPSPTPECGGDCDGDGHVTVDELVRLTRIALDELQLSECPSGDVNGDSQVAVDDIVAATGFAIVGCVPLTPVPTPTPTPPVTPSLMDLSDFVQFAFERRGSFGFCPPRDAVYAARIARSDDGYSLRLSYLRVGDQATDDCLPLPPIGPPQCLVVAPLPERSLTPIEVSDMQALFAVVPVFSQPDPICDDIVIDACLVNVAAWDELGVDDHPCYTLPRTDRAYMNTIITYLERLRP